MFGLLGDRIDRGRVLVATIVCMGVATTLIGVLPTYESVGVTATVLLIVLRLVQGFSVGAEVAGAATFVSEAVPNRCKGRFGVFKPAGATGGFALAAAVTGTTSAIVGPKTDGRLGVAGAVPGLAAAERSRSARGDRARASSGTPRRPRRREGTRPSLMRVCGWSAGPDRVAATRPSAQGGDLGFDFDQRPTHPSTKPLVRSAPGR